MCVFFYLRVVTKSPAEMSMSIGAVLELHSHANLPCLVKLAHNVLTVVTHMVIHEIHYALQGISNVLKLLL